VIFEILLGAPGFGSDAQQLHAFSGLQDGLVKLSWRPNATPDFFQAGM
jgi:hypothetical protein